MRDDLEQRAQDLAVYMIETRATVRAAAKKFEIFAKNSCIIKSVVVY